jgi:hypothetical protein
VVDFLDKMTERGTRVHQLPMIPCMSDARIKFTWPDLTIQDSSRTAWKRITFPIKGFYTMEAIYDFRPKRETIFWTCAHISDFAMHDNSLKRMQVVKKFSTTFTLTNFTVSLNAEISISSDGKNLIISIVSVLSNAQHLKLVSSFAACWISLQNGNLLPKNSNTSYEFTSQSSTTSVSGFKPQTETLFKTRNEILFQISDFTKFPDEYTINLEDLQLEDLHFEVDYFFNFRNASVKKVDEETVLLRRMKSLDHLVMYSMNRDSEYGKDMV